jgi:FkbM family methyltransferase
LSKLNKLEHPTRYLFSRFLVRTGLCRLLTIKTNGYKLHYFPTAISSELWQNPSARIYEMLPYIKAGDIIVDVGANVGTTVIPSAMAVGDSGTVLAFEAHPKTFQYLESNVKLNNLTNVKLFHNALGEKKGKVTFSDNDADDQNSVIFNSNSGISVDVTVLDDFTEDFEKIDLLKIDVEGYELFVLQGAEETLQKTKCINIEISEAHFAKFGYSCKTVIEFLEKKF